MHNKSSVFSAGRRAGVLAAALVLAGCGGGGGEEAVSPAVPLAAAFGSFVSDPATSQVTYSGMATGPTGQQIPVSGSSSVSEVTTPSTFNNAPALRKTITERGQLVLLGNSYPLNTTSSSYFSPQYAQLGGLDDGGYCTVTDYQALPVTARAGHASAWFKESCYTNSSKTVLTGSAVTSWTVEADSATSLRFKSLTRLTDTSGTVSESTRTLRITTAGAVQRLEDSGTLAFSGVTLRYTGTYR